MEDIRFVFAELLFVIQSDLNINIENAFASFMRFQKKMKKQRENMEK